MNQSNFLKLSGALALTVGLLNCAIVTINHSPRTAPEGSVEADLGGMVGIGIQVKTSDDDGNSTGTSSSGGATKPLFAGGFRYGIIDQLDVGVAFDVLGNASLDVKYNFIKPDKMFALSVFAGFQELFFVIPGGYIGVIGGVDLGKVVNIYAGAKLGFFSWGTTFIDTEADTRFLMLTITPGGGLEFAPHMKVSPFVEYNLSTSQAFAPDSLSGFNLEFTTHLINFGLRIRPGMGKQATRQPANNNTINNKTGKADANVHGSMSAKLN